MTTQATETLGLISHFRVLDLTGASGQLAGKILADMGADVIKIEPPIGDEARAIGPFYQNDVSPEKSLWWWAYNTSKRGITTDLATADGRALFTQLVTQADVVIESFKPGYMTSLGLDYKRLLKLNPSLVMASLSPFGQDGPNKDFIATDFITVAMSGNMYLTGDQDRPPVACQMPTTYFHTCSELANSVLIALWHRENTGEGQYIDTSIHETMQVISTSGPIMWHLKKEKGRRSGAGYPVKGPAGVTFQREIWPCKDGYISFGIRGGPARIPGFQRLFEWIRSEGYPCDYMKIIDWPKYDNNVLRQEDVDKLASELQGFFSAKTAKELYEEAIKQVLMIAPVYSPQMQLQDRHLKAREFFVEVAHPETGQSFVYPGPFVKSDLGLVRLRKRAPLIGEHNAEVYEGVLGLSRKELTRLQKAKAI